MRNKPSKYLFHRAIVCNMMERDITIKFTFENHVQISFNILMNLQVVYVCKCTKMSRKRGQRYAYIGGKLNFQLHSKTPLVSRRE